MTERLITRIVDSLQVHVREVHVRYEVPTYVNPPYFLCLSLETRSCPEDICCMRLHVI